MFVMFSGFLARLLPPGYSRLTFPAYAFLAGFALIVFLPGFFTLPPIDRDEAHFAQASRQMVAARDYMNIHFQDEARLKKPPGIYWLQAAVVETANFISGKDVGNTIWLYRLPSLLGAVLAVLFTAAIGARLYTPQVGFTAGLLLASIFLLSAEARMAKTDAMLLATILGAVGVMAKAYVRAGMARALKAKDVIFFWLSIVAGFLIKGPVILLVVFGLLLGLRLMRQPIDWIKYLRPVSGAIAAAALIAPWFYYVGQQQGAELINQSAGNDFFAKLWHAQNWGGGVPGFHFIVLWGVMWPASLPVFLMLPHVWKSRAEPVTRFLLAWVIPCWLLFEITATKLVHYVLPLYPALIILGAAWLNANHDDINKKWRIAVCIIWAAVGLGLAVAAFALPSMVEHRIDFLLAFILSFSIAAAMAAVCVLINPEHPTQIAVAPLAIAGALFTAAMFGVSLPGTHSVFLSPQIAAAIPEIKGCTKTNLIAAGYREPSLIFLTGKDTRYVASGEAVADAIRKEKCTAGLVDKEALTGFQKTARRMGVHAKETALITGFNYGDGHPAELHIFVKRR